MSVPAAYITVVFIWATTPLSIQWSTVGIDPSFSLLLRVALSAVVGYLMLRVWRVHLPCDRQAMKCYGVAAVGIVPGLLLVYEAAQSLDSGLISLIFGMAPLMSYLFGRAMGIEPKWNLRRGLAFAIAVCGLVLVLNPSAELEWKTLRGVMLTLASAALMAFSGVYLKKMTVPVAALPQTVGALLVSVPMLSLLCFLQWGVSGLPSLSHETLSLKTFAAIAYLGIAGSLLGFMCYYYVLKHMAATSVAMITIVTPVAAITLGVWLADEVLSAELVSGATLILLALLLFFGRGVPGKSLFLKLRLFLKVRNSQVRKKVP